MKKPSFLLVLLSGCLLVTGLVLNLSPRHNMAPLEHPQSPVALVEKPITRAAATPAAAAQKAESISEKIIIPRGNALAADKASAIKPVTELQFAAFNEWSDKFIKANAAERTGLEAEGVALATERRSALAEMIQKNPERALELAVPYGTRAELPSSIASLLEERVSGRGKIDVVRGLSPQGPIRTQTASIGDRTYGAFTYGRRDSMVSKGNVVMHGIVVNNLVAVHENPVRLLGRDEAVAAVARINALKAAEPVCAVSNEPINVNGEETFVEADGDIISLCQVAHADNLNQELEEEEITLSLASLGNATKPDNRVLVVNVMFDGENEPATGAKSAATLKTQFIDRVGLFYRNASYMKCGIAALGATGSKYITVTLTKTRTYYRGLSNHGTSWHWNGADTLRADIQGRIGVEWPGVILGDYDLRGYCFTGMQGDSGGDWYFSGLSLGGGVTLYNGEFSANLTCHEFGHAITLSHAGAWMSNVDNDPINSSDITDCVKRLYGDNFDMIGNASLENWTTGKQHYNVYHKRDLNWIRDVDTTTVTSSGLYRLWANDILTAPDYPDIGGGTRQLAVKILKDARTYWLGVRQLYTAAENEWLANGVQVFFQDGGIIPGHGAGDADTCLIDMTPNSKSRPSNIYNPIPDMDDSALVMGKTFSDKASDIHITPVQTGMLNNQKWVMLQINKGTTVTTPPSADFIDPTFDENGTYALDEHVFAVTKSANFSYYWQFSDGGANNWLDDYQSPGNTNSIKKTYTTTGVKAVRCIVSNMKGGKVTLTRNFTISAGGSTPPYINPGGDPVNKTVGTGTNATFTVSAGPAGCTYKWKENGSIIAGATSSSYTVVGPSLGKSGNKYRAVVVNDGISIESAEATLTVQDKVVISSISPGNIAKNVGDSIVMTPVFTAPQPTSPTYNWFKGTSSLGVTTPSLTLNNLGTGSAGDYSCVVTNLVSKDTNKMTLTINASVVTVTDPSPLTATNNINTTNTFTVVAGGTGPFFYHWYYNDNTLIPWATGPSMTLTNLQFTNDGNYKCIVTNSAGTMAVSDNAYQKVLWPVAIVGNISNRTNNVGDNAYFSVTATGTNLAYTWYSNTTAIAGQTSSNLNLTVGTNLLGVNYKVVVSCTDSFYATNTATSAVATVSIPYAGWTKLVQWNYNSATPDGNVSTGTTNTSYTNTMPVGFYTNFSGLKSNYIAGSFADVASLSTDNSAVGYTNRWPTTASGNKRTNGLQFRLSTTNFTNIVVTWEQRNSAQASKYMRLMYITNGLTGTTNLHTVHTNTVTNQYVYFSSDLSGKAGVHNNTNLVIRIASEWESTATGGGVAGYVGTQGGAYETNGTVHYDMVTVWGKPTPVSIVTQPQSATVATGGSTNFTVGAVGLSLTYQWRTNGGVILNATNATLTLNNIQKSSFTNYTVKITNAYSPPLTSSVAVLTVLDPAGITTHPANQTTYVGFGTSLSVSATGDNLKYQWNRDGSPLLNETNATLVRNPVQSSDAGVYFVTVSNVVSISNSANATLTVNAIPTNSYWSANGSTYGGGGTWNTTTLNRWGFSSGGPFTYAWTNSWTNSAYFGGTAGTVTVGAAVTANKVVFETGGYTLGGNSTLTFAGTDAGIDNPGVTSNTSTTNKVTVDCPVAGPVFVKSGGGRIYFYNSANAIERWIVKGGAISAEGQFKLFGPAPATLVTNYLTLDGGGLGYSTGGTGTGIYTNRGIYLGPNNGQLGLGGSSLIMTIDGPITGPGSLSFSGPTNWPGQVYGSAGTFILTNPNNDYQGATTIEVGKLITSNSFVLPLTTTLTVTGNATVDLSNTDQEVDTLVVDGSNAQITNGTFYANAFDLRQSGVISATLQGGSLTKTTANNVTLNEYNTYTGDTTLSAGTVTLNEVGGFGDVGTLNLAGGGIVLTQTRDTNSPLLNPVIMTANTTIQNGDTGANAILFLHDGSWTTTGGTLTIKNATSAAGGLFDLVLANAFTFTQPIVIGVIGEQACQLTGFNTNTLTQTFSGVISGPGTFHRSVVADGLSIGGRTVLTAANTYTGTTTVDAGTLVVNNATGSGTGTSNVIVTAMGQLVGTGTIAGNVAVSSGTISAGDGVGILTLQNGLNLSSGGTNLWELNALTDDVLGVAGTDYDQVVLTGGQLQLGGSSKLMLSFGGGTPPIDSEAFWRGNHTWKIVNLSGGSNPGSTIFSSVVNGTYSCGTFTTEADGSGNLILRYTTSISSSIWWSANGSTLGGTGLWDTTNARWGVTNVSPFNLVWNNASINSAIFAGNGATPGNVTNNVAITVNKITVTNSTSAAYVFTGTNTITFAGSGAGVFVQGANNGNTTTNVVVFNAKLAGPVVTKTGGGRMTMNNTGNNVGKWVVNGGIITVATGTTADVLFGTGLPATLVADLVTLDGGGLAVSTTGSMSVGTNRGIYLGLGGGKIGNNGASGIITIDGPISGPGDLHFPGVTEFPGQQYGDDCIFIISNTNNNYGGWTRIARPEVRLGNHQVFPATTTLNITNGAINGRLNLYGFNQTVAKVILDTTNGTSKIMDTVGGGSLTADHFELRRTASTAGVTAVLAGSGFLTKTTTGNVHLLATNTYTGDTTISEGTLTIDGFGTFGSGAGALNLAGGGIILNANRTMAYALMNPLVMTADSSIKNGDAGTGVVQFPYGGTWAGTGGTLTISNMTSTGAGSFDVVLTNGFTFTQPIVLAGNKPCQLTSFNSSTAADQIFSGQISGVGTFRRSVSSGLGGQTILSADNAYSGVTIVDAGTLFVNNPGPGSGTSTNIVTVSGGGTLAGSGIVGGSVVVNSGGSISAGVVAGQLTLQNGLNLSSSGTNIWDLSMPADDFNGAAGVSADQLVLTGGNLALGGTSKLMLNFPGTVSAPDILDPFWRVNHTWTIVKLNGGINTGSTKFTTILNPTNSVGYFMNSVDAFGNIILTFTSYSTNDLFWSGDGTSLGGAGTWHTNATGGKWANASVGPYSQLWANSSGKGAIFDSLGGVVTIGTNITVNKVIVGVKNYSFGGTNRLTFSGTGAGVDYKYQATGDSYSLDLDCAVSGTLITKTGAGRLHLTSTTNMVSKWSVLEGMISVASVSRFGTNPAVVVPDYLTLNGGGLGFDGTSPTMDTNRGVTLGTNGGKMGVRSSSVTLTVQAPLTGPGGISFPGYSSFATRIHGGPGTFILNNTNNNYQGETAVGVGTLKLGKAGVLPDTTTLNITGSATVDLNGFNETAAILLLNGSSASVIGTNTLTVTNGIDARRSGDVSAKLAGNSALTKTTTNTVTLSASNTYSGGTFVMDGTLLINNTNGTGTGTNIVTVGDVDGEVAGILGGTGIIGAKVMLNAGGTISPGTNAVGTLTLTNGLNLTNGGNMVWELGALKDNVDGVFGVDFDKLAITGGQLLFGENSALTIQFTGTATAPDSTVPFWQVNHTWKVMVLSGNATNINNQTFSNLVYAVNDAGSFSNYVSGTNLMLTFLAGVLDPQAVVETPPLQPSVRLLSGGTHGVQITWPTVAGVRYEVQYTSDLNNPNWQVLGEVIAQENSISATDFPPMDEPQRFYRLMAK